ncbi:MAG: 6,7-dimethyl-8-ribityllumazine synthase [Oligoflexia bacterium]|nr:6,7-dimethyl-8-ribityllumazine synthase [Oligoflexia bacterium]
MKKIEGQLSATGLRFALIASRFNSFIVDQLVNGAVDTIVRHGGRKSEISIIHVPGSFEIPLAAKKAAASGKFDAIVALGAVIRGATTHYDYVCGQAASGIGQVALETGLPVTFGVITTDTIDQAIERAGTKAGNKGADAALAAIEMANLSRILEKGEI